MKKLIIKGKEKTSQILVGETLQNLSEYIPNEKVVIITDTNVGRLYADKFPDFDIITIKTGEGIKTLETVNFIFNEFVNLNIDRSYFVVGIGGGILCDIAGFVSSTYLRGVRFGFVSSTLLSQVDASVGGKNGVNFQGFKNMVGVFNQPDFVICDMNLLNTLPQREILCGFGEIVKHTLIADVRMFEFLEQNHQKAIKLDKETIETLVNNSVNIKANIVNQDEREKGERRKLNFGHTFAHAIEKNSVDVLHGEAVSIGILVAAKLSEKQGLLNRSEVDRIEQLLINLGLPTKLEIDKNKALEAIKKDKKREGNHIHFILLEGIGKAIIKEISINELEDVVNDLYSNS